MLDDGRSFHMEILLVDHFYHGKLVRTKTTTRETFAEVRSADTTTAHSYDRESGQRIREGREGICRVGSLVEYTSEYTCSVSHTSRRRQRAPKIMIPRN